MSEQANAMTKQGFDQHNLLHLQWPQNCCLCRAETGLAALRAENEHLLKCSHAWMLEANKATARIAELMAALETALRPLKLEHAYLNEAVDDHCNKKAPNGVAWQDCFCITAGDLRQASRLWDGFIDPPCTAAALKETPNDEG